MEYERDVTILLPPKKKPCGKCPFRRTAPAGWLGGSTPEEYHLMAHSDVDVACHTQKGFHDSTTNPLRSCAGLAVYRNNSLKSPRGGSALVACDTVAKDTDNEVFKHREFLEHHSKGILRNER
jgi:hypothetical protein